MVVLRHQMNNIARNILLTYIKEEYDLGRPRKLSFEYILDRIFYLLRTGSQWSNLHVHNGSWKTIYHYFAKWSKEHVFERSFHQLIQFYVKRRGITHTITDTSFVKNIFGKDCVGRSPVDRGRKATKVSLLTDSFGTPLHILFHPGNKNDGKTLHHLLTKTQKYINLGGKEIYGDKAYCSERCENVIRKFNMKNKITKKRLPLDQSQNRKRIFVEHSFAWFDKYRRIILRYDGLVCHFRSFHYCAALNLVAQRSFFSCRK